MWLNAIKSRLSQDLTTFQGYWINHFKSLYIVTRHIIPDFYLFLVMFQLKPWLFLHPQQKKKEAGYSYSSFPPSRKHENLCYVSLLFTSRHGCSQNSLSSGWSPSKSYPGKTNRCQGEDCWEKLMTQTNVYKIFIPGPLRESHKVVIQGQSWNKNRLLLVGDPQKLAKHL